jgi:hypothetical protein
VSSSELAAVPLFQEVLNGLKLQHWTASSRARMRFPLLLCSVTVTVIVGLNIFGNC